jgi:hypothetical protein
MDAGDGDPSAQTGQLRLQFGQRPERPKRPRSSTNRRSTIPRKFSPRVGYYHRSRTHDPILICSRADSLLFQAQAHFPEGVRQIKSVAALEQGRSGTHLRDPVCQWGCLSNLVRGSPMTTVPLPSTLTFVASGLGGLVLLRWRRTKKAAMLAAAWAKHQIEIWRDRREAVFLFARITKEALQIRLLANG